MIKAYSYSIEDKSLAIVFNDGTERTYKNVPPDTMSQVFDAPGSIGSKFHRLIGKRYQSSPTA